jgi:hypothetical protein
MSTTIGFQGNDVWFKANWVVAQFFADVEKMFHLSDEDRKELELGLVFNGMNFRRMAPDMRKRIMHMLKVTALSLANDNEGKYRDEVFNDEQYKIYRGAFPSLLELIDKYENADWPPPKERG